MIPGFYFFALSLLLFVCFEPTISLPQLMSHLPFPQSFTRATSVHTDFSFLWGSGSHIESLAYVLLYFWVFLNSLFFPLGLNSFCSSVFLWQFALLLLGRVHLFVTPWPVACQAPLSSSVSWSLLTFMSLEPVWCYLTISSSATPFSCCLQSFLASRSFPMDLCRNLSQWIFASGGHSIGASASTSILPMNIQGWFFLGLTDLISLQYKGLSRVFSSTTIQKLQFFGFSLLYGPALSIHIWLLEKP